MTISKQTKSPSSTKILTSMKILLPTSPNVKTIQFRKNFIEEAINLDSELPNRSLKNQRHIFISQSPWKINLDLHDFESFEKKIDKEKRICAKKRDYNRIFKSGRLRRKRIKLYHPEEAVVRWGRKSQAVIIIWFRYYLKWMEILTTDALGLQYVIKSKKLV